MADPAAAAAAAVVIAINFNAVLPRAFPGQAGRPDLPLFMDTSDKEKAIEVEGRVLVVLPGTMFRVELENKHVVLATICGQMRKRFVRLTVGDRVKMDMSPYDLNKGRITWRLR